MRRRSLITLCIIICAYSITRLHINMANKTTRKQTTRRSRNRRGSSRRLVRRNKTCKMMKGGRVDDSTDTFPISLSTYKNTGYKYASESLFNTTKPEYKLVKNGTDYSRINPLIVTKIKNDYRVMYNLQTTNREIPKYEPDEKSSSIMSIRGQSAVMLPPEKFNKCIDYIVSGKIETRWRTETSTRGTNRDYIDFGKSFRRLTGENDDGLLGQITTAFSGKVPNFTSAAGSNLGSVAQGLLASQEGQKLAAGAQNVIGSVTSGKYSGAASEFAGSLLKNAPGPLGTVARLAPGIVGTVATKAAGRAARLAVKDPAGAMAMAKQFGAFGSNWS
jgi:hypothetical protein